MANTYPILVSNALSALLAAIKQDGVNISPLDSEAANVLGSVDRQTRWFLYSFLSSVFDDNGQLLPGTVNGQGETFNQQISGSSSNAITGLNGGAIIQGTVSTPDLRSQAVTFDKIANGAVGPTQLQAGLLSSFVTLSLTNWITATMLTAQSVGTAAIVDAAITAQKIALGAITAAQIASNSISYDRLQNALGSGYMLVSGLTPFTFSAVPMTGDATLDNTGKLTITRPLVLPFAVLTEVTPSGTHAGDSATGFAIRGAVANMATTWQIQNDSSNLFVSVPTTDGKLKVAAGTYLVEGQCPGYQCGIHKAFPQSFTSLNVVNNLIYGSNAVAATSSGVGDESHFVGEVVVPAGGYIAIYHYVSSIATHGYGIALNVGGFPETFSTLKLTKLA